MVAPGSFGTRGQRADRQPARGQRAGAPSRTRRRDARCSTARHAAPCSRPPASSSSPTRERCTALADEAIEVVKRATRLRRLRRRGALDVRAPRRRRSCSARWPHTPRRIVRARRALSRSRDARRSTASPTSGFAIPAGPGADCGASRSSPDPVACVRRAPGHPLARARRPTLDALCAASIARRERVGRRRRGVPGALGASGHRATGGSVSAVTRRPRSRWRATTTTSRSSTVDRRVREIRPRQLAPGPSSPACRDGPCSVDFVHRTADRDDPPIAGDPAALFSVDSGRQPAGTNRGEHLGGVRVARRSVGRLEVQAQQRLGVARTQVEPPVAARRR